MIMRRLLALLIFWVGIVPAFMKTVAPRLFDAGYRLETQSQTMLMFGRKQRPAWTFVVAILAFPLGLIALLYEDESQVILAIDPGESETSVQISGTAPMTVRRAVLNLDPS